MLSDQIERNFTYHDCRESCEACEPEQPQTVKIG